MRQSARPIAQRYPAASSAGQPLRLTPTTTRHHNGLVRLRLILIALALVALAFAGLRQDVARAPHAGGIASSHLSSQPAPDHEPPTIVRAVVTAAATAQTHVACEPRGRERSAQDVSIDRRRPLHEPACRASLPQSFPLLI